MLPVILDVNENGAVSQQKVFADNLDVEVRFSSWKPSHQATGKVMLQKEPQEHRSTRTSLPAS
jgi:hypothetical protein